MSGKQARRLRKQQVALHAVLDRELEADGTLARCRRAVDALDTPAAQEMLQQAVKGAKSLADARARFFAKAREIASIVDLDGLDVIVNGDSRGLFVRVAASRATCDRALERAREASAGASP